MKLDKKDKRKYAPKLMDICINYYGLKELGHDFLRGRKQIQVEARMMFACLMYNILDMSAEEVGAFLERDRTTISVMIKKWNDYIYYDTELKKNYLHLKEVFKQAYEQDVQFKSKIKGNCKRIDRYIIFST